MSVMTRTELQPRSGGALAEEYSWVRGWSLALCAPLTPEDMLVQSCADASPAKWHLAHTTWFFETFVLREYLPGYRPFNPDFIWLFNSYYNAVSAQPEKKLRSVFSRPSLEEILAYRRSVDAAMENLAAGELPGEARARIVLGLNHEQQHQELIVTDLKHAFWTNPLRPAYAEFQGPAASAPPLAWTEFGEGVYQVGHDGTGFAFDNESPRHRVYLKPFRLASRLVTNAEYLEFMADGGYRNPALWLSDAWDQVVAGGWRAPLYWEQGEDGWVTFTCAGMRPLDPNEPVCHVSYYEADAFARWREARLPSEAEWEIAASADRGIAGALLESGRFHPAGAQRGAGLRQMIGDLWEWTSSPYSPYPGYSPAAGVLGEYNGKFMCNQMVLRGGSCATPASHIRPTYRNFFPPQARWQFSGIRLAHDC